MRDRHEKPLIACSIFTTTVKRWKLGINQCEDIWHANGNRIDNTDFKFDICVSRDSADMIPKNLWKRGMPSHVPPSPQMGLGLGCMAYRCVSLISLCLQDKFSRKNFVNIWTGFIGSTHESS